MRFWDIFVELILVDIFDNLSVSFGQVAWILVNAFIHLSPWGELLLFVGEIVLEGLRCFFYDEGGLLVLLRLESLRPLLSSSLLGF